MAVVAEVWAVVVLVRVAHAVVVDALATARDEAVHAEAGLRVNKALSVRRGHAGDVSRRRRSPCP